MTPQTPTTPAPPRPEAPKREAKQPQPLLHTPVDEQNENERLKRDKGGYQGNLYEDVRKLDAGDLEHEAETLAKSHGIYLEYNRAKTGREKDWMYMVRISVPGGGAFDRRQWQTLDDLAEKYTGGNGLKPSLRLTTRQNIQFHWITKPHLVEVVRTIAQTGFYTLNGCGDNTRNVMGCPLSRFSDVFNAHAMAQKYGRYFELPAEPHIRIFQIDTSYSRFGAESAGDSTKGVIGADDPEAVGKFEYGAQLLNRKFKIAFSAVHRNPVTGELEHDNCVELRTNDMGVAPIVDPRTEKVVAFQVYIGGSQGEKNGKATFAGFGSPLAIFTPENLHKGLDAVVKVHQEWGDRKNRHWARIKYVVHSMGIGWYQDQIRAAGAVFDDPDPDFDPGARMLHHGWLPQPSNGKLARGVYIENGRLRNGGTTGQAAEQLKSMVRHLMDSYDTEVMVTPNQDLVFTNLDAAAKESFDADLARFGYGQRNGKTGYSSLRVLSGACVGLDTCRLSYTESEQFEPELMDKLEDMGYGDVPESIGITGCERQCFRAGTKSIGWVGQGPDMYGLKLGGSEDARFQGVWLTDGDKWYCRQVSRADVPKVSAALFDLHRDQRQGDEDLGATMRRLGNKAILDYLRGHPNVAHVVAKAAPAPYMPYGPVGGRHGNGWAEPSAAAREQAKADAAVVAAAGA